MNFPKHLFKALAIGAIAGMRSVSALAFLSDALHKNSSPNLDDSPLHFLQSGKVANGLKLLAAAEMAGDKVPGVPDRIEAPSLLARSISGAIAGAVIFKTNNDDMLKGALAGTTAAVAATYGMFYLRKILAEKSGIADPVLGALEDALVLKAGSIALES